MDGHADNAPGTLSDLASLLPDTLDESGAEDDEALTDDPTAEDGDTGESDTDGQDESDEDNSETEEQAEPAPERKLKVTIQGEDGANQEVEVTETELVKGYQRQADYTRKTQELSHREAEAVDLLKSKYQEFSQTYAQKTEASRAAIVQLAGLRSEQEMAQLAHTDPAAWVAENQRQQMIANVVAQLDGQIAHERQVQAQMQQEAQARRHAEMYQKTWAELQKDGIDRDALAAMYSDASKAYGFNNEDLATILDSRQVKVLRDALAYRKLQAQKPAVKQSVQNAPKVQQKNSTNVRKDEQVQQRFRSGRASLRDLAASLPDL
jgi:hypothetical protein